MITSLWLDGDLDSLTVSSIPTHVPDLELYGLYGHFQHKSFCDSVFIGTAEKFICITFLSETVSVMPYHGPRQQRARKWELSLQRLFTGTESVPQLPLVLSKASAEAVELFFI